jgi:UDP-N-acetylglucosamine acyltransferase
MKRRGYGADLIEHLQRAYRTVYRSGLTVKEACAELEPLADRVPEVRAFVASVGGSRWGIVRPRGRRGQSDDS